MHCTDILWRSLLNSCATLLVAANVAAASTVTFNFDGGDGGIQDTGFTMRLAGTGELRPSPDPNLLLAGGILTFDSTADEFNGGVSAGDDHIQALGILLSSAGFSGSEDISVSARFNNVQDYAAAYQQFGLFIGVSGESLFRAGALGGNFADIGFPGAVNGRNSFVASNAGNDFGVAGRASNAAQVGNSVIYTIRRTNSVWRFVVDNLTDDARDGIFLLNSTENISAEGAPPSFLDGASDLTVGVFTSHVGASQFTQTLDWFSVTVSPPPVEGDVDGDGDVDQFDYQVILDNMFKPALSRMEGDLNDDGLVDYSDYRAWKLARLSVLQSAADAHGGEVPEPATATIVATLLVGLLATRPRCSPV